MRVPFIDLGRQIAPLRGEIDAAIGACIDHNRFIQGTTVEAFEQAYAKTVGCRHAVGCGSGTDALYLALKALGVGAGDEVILPALTFAATAEAVVMAGARPVIVDVGSDDMCIDVSAIEAALSPRTRVVIAVHLFGRLADMADIRSLADRRRVRVIADSAQAHGAVRHGQGPEFGADIGCYSFYPGKNLGAFGDAGGCVTDDDDLARDMRMRRDHGREDKNRHEFCGVNMRMDEIQAAVLRVKLPHLAVWNDARRAIAARYTSGFASITDLTVPLPDADELPAWHLYVVRTPGRDRLRDHLLAADIQCRVHYPVPLDAQPAFSEFAPAPCPRAADIASCSLALPMFESMRPDECERVVQVVQDFFHSPDRLQ